MIGVKSFLSAYQNGAFEYHRHRNSSLTNFPAKNWPLSKGNSRRKCREGNLEIDLGMRDAVDFSSVLADQAF
jgi:hypothetical protein